MRFVLWQAWQLLEYRVVRDNTTLAKLIVEASREHRPFFQLALDMLHRESQEDIMLDMLLADCTDYGGECPDSAFQACVGLALRQLHRLPPTLDRVLKFSRAAVKTFVFRVHKTHIAHQRTGVVFQDELLEYVATAQ